MKISNIAHGGYVECQAIVPKYGLRGYSPDVVTEGLTVPKLLLREFDPMGVCRVAKDLLTSLLFSVYYGMNSIIPRRKYYE